MEFSAEAELTFTVTEDLSLTANFKPIPTCTIAFVCNNPDWSYISVYVNNAQEIAENAFTCNENESVFITATPNEGFHFVNWTKGNELFATEAEFTFTATENLELTANFEKDQNNVGNESREEYGFRVYARDRVIYLSEHREVQVYNTVGQCLYNGHATAIPVRQSGVYIVRVDTRSYKVIVR